ncbi:MAG: hypothetical protein ACK5Q5_16225 [Planctomycetaceae bacterium]
MLSSHRSILGWGSLTALLAGICWWSSVGGAEPGLRSVASPDVPEPLPTVAVMHAKLTATQQILAALLSEDYRQIEAAARELVGLARDVPSCQTGNDASNQVYEHFRYEMLRLSSDLEQMGANGNLAGAAYVHGNLTAACIGCHQHLRDEQPRIELMELESQPALFEVESRRNRPINVGDR